MDWVAQVAAMLIKRHVSRISWHSNASLFLHRDQCDYKMSQTVRAWIRNQFRWADPEQTIACGMCWQKGSKWFILRKFNAIKKRSIFLKQSSLYCIPSINLNITSLSLFGSYPPFKRWCWKYREPCEMTEATFFQLSPGKRRFEYHAVESWAVQPLQHTSFWTPEGAMH